MSWHAHLSLDYRLEQGRSVARFLHRGPLRILQSHYPEGPTPCHNVLVHPPGGLVGGDTLDIDVRVGEGAHGLVTTPGATRFYRSEAGAARQAARLVLAPGARLEWLPLEALCYSGCLAENALRAELAGDAELIAWDVTALGLPGAGRPFERGSLLQHIELPGVWLERGRIEAADRRLLHSPLGLGGHACLATLFFACGMPIARARRDAALDAARAVIAQDPLEASAGATSPQPEVVVLRALAPLVEPAMQLLRRAWRAWRAELWQMDAPPPRIWSL